MFGENMTVASPWSMSVPSCGVIAPSWVPSHRHSKTNMLSRAASHENASTSGSNSETYQFTYKGSDGRLKATFEQAFKTGGGKRSEENGHSQAPWQLGYQMSEKNLAWNDDLKARLLIRVAADKIGGLSDAEIEQRLRKLQALLPDLANKLPMMKPSIVTAMLQEADVLPSRLLNLKAVFPGADVSKLAMREPALVLGFVDAEHVANVAAQLREILPGLDVDRLVEENPSMLDVEELRAAMAEASRIMPDLDIQKAMGSDPQIILSFQRGSQLIPYDPPTPENEADDTQDDDEYAAYYS